jgi:ATP-dependent DNA helicase RecQ
MTEISDTDARITQVLRTHWGFDVLRPNQGEAIRATLAGRDLLAVLPTGGGKSLCYQVPPLVTGLCTLVVSPLIALMRDQVSSMEMAGVPAAASHGHLAPAEAAKLRERARARELRLLYVAPERVMASDFLAMCVKMGVGAIAIDEAHCISQWGHDFRPEYRRLAELREVFPEVPIAAYTATATPQVRDDIEERLGLREPVRIVGDFDRPNLTYRVVPRVDMIAQTAEAITRHAGSASIVYGITRKDAEETAEALRERGIDAQAYHAGLTPKLRTRISDDFRNERIDVVCATVAFGMGIDRGDVRCVVHTALPKSIEAYQQETGRAGRDGLPAECVLLQSGADAARWSQIMEKGSAESDGGEDAAIQLEAQLELLGKMWLFAGGARCRHRALVEYFGQEYPGGSCGACDVCLGELVPVRDGHDTARKIISCVARCGSRFGAGHIADVLVGSGAKKIRECGHDALSTFGLLRQHSRDRIVAWIGQLVEAGHLTRTGGRYPVISTSSRSTGVLRNETEAVLWDPPEPKIERVRIEKKTASATDGLNASDAALFERLRAWRRRAATDRSVPPFVIMSDAVLVEVCRSRPASVEELRWVKGIGAKKMADFGQELVDEIRSSVNS